MTEFPELYLKIFMKIIFCLQCPFELQKTLEAGVQSTFVVNTARRATWRVYEDVSEQYMSAANAS